MPPSSRTRSRRTESTSTSLERLFAENVDAVFGFALTRCGDRVLAEEVASDTFAEAARVLSRRPDQELHRGWLFDVARKRLIDHWRREARHQRRLERLQHLGELLPPEDSILESNVLDALDGLPQRQRAALVLHYLDGYKAGEIAEAFDVSVAAIESLLARGRRSLLRAYLERIDE